MSTSQRARLALLLELHTSQHGSGVPTFLLSDAEAVALVTELGAEASSELEHPATVGDGLALLAALGAAPSAEDEDALAEWAQRNSEASAKLWDGLSGQVIDGVAIARKPPKPNVAPTESASPEA